LGLLESIRKWIDGETGEDLLEAADEHAKPRRVWEEFLVKIAREVEAAMQREMFTPPGGPTYIPREYIVYLSADDDKDWQGDKRRGLEQGLFHVLSERARELSGTTNTQALNPWLFAPIRVYPRFEFFVFSTDFKSPITPLNCLLRPALISSALPATTICTRTRKRRNSTNNSCKLRKVNSPTRSLRPGTG